MSTLLLSKTYYPPAIRQGSIRRPHLVKKLEQGRTKKLSTIIAPAGFGKSSLVSEWIEQSAVPCIWMRLGKEDHELSYFLIHLITALQSSEADFGQDLLYALNATEPALHETIVPTLITKLQALDFPLTLVLDDLYLAANNEINLALYAIIHGIPPTIHLVIITREEPDLSLARLRSEGQISEISRADLQFDLSEIEQLFATTLDFQLSRADFTILENRTEGWIAGLQLALISLQGQENPSAFIKTFNGNSRLIQDYLIEEVLKQQPDEIKQFLIATSVLESFNAALCNAVIANTTAPRILDYLESAHLFIVALDNQRQWYRYHHLFRDLLRQNLHDTTYASMLHERAINWYLAQGLEIEAFYQGISSGDLSRTITLIENQGMPFYFKGLGKAVIAWAESLTKLETDRQAKIYLHHAWSLIMNGRPRLVEAKLQALELAYATEPHTITQDLSGQIIALRALASLALQPTPEVIPRLQAALELLDKHNHAVRTAVQCTLALAYQMAGKDDQALVLFRQVIENGQASGNLMFTIAASAALGQFLERENKLFEARQVYQRALEIITDPEHLVGCEAHIGLARLYCEWGEFDLAETHNDTGERLAAQLECSIQLSASLVRTRLYLAKKNAKAAKHVVDNALETARVQSFEAMIPSLMDLKIKCLIELGELQEAHVLADHYELVEGKTRVLIALESYQKALPCMSNPAKPLPRFVELSLQAQILFALKKTAEAIDIILELFEMSKSAGFLQSFVAEGEGMFKLLREVQKQGYYRAEIDKILLLAKATTVTPKQHLAEPLSERELEVLTLISHGLSNLEISEKLFISLSTIKWHNQKIFEKLQVQRRTEAIVRATELGLLYEPHPKTIL